MKSFLVILLIAMPFMPICMSKSTSDEIIEDVMHFTIGYVSEKCSQSPRCMPYLMWITIILVVYIVSSVYIFGERVPCPTSRNVGWTCVGVLAAKN